MTVPMLKWIGGQFDDGAQSQGDELPSDCGQSADGLVLYDAGQGVLRQQWSCMTRR